MSAPLLPSVREALEISRSGQSIAYIAPFLHRMAFSGSPDDKELLVSFLNEKGCLAALDRLVTHRESPLSRACLYRAMVTSGDRKSAEDVAERRLEMIVRTLAHEKSHAFPDIFDDMQSLGMILYNRVASAKLEIPSELLVEPMRRFALNDKGFSWFRAQNMAYLCNIAGLVPSSRQKMKKDNLDTAAIGWLARYIVKGDMRAIRVCFKFVTSVMEVTEEPGTTFSHMYNGKERQIAMKELVIAGVKQRFPEGSRLDTYIANFLLTGIERAMSDTVPYLMDVAIVLYWCTKDVLDVDEFPFVLMACITRFAAYLVEGLEQGSDLAADRVVDVMREWCPLGFSQKTLDDAMEIIQDVAPNAICKMKREEIALVMRVSLVVEPVADDESSDQSAVV